MINGAKRKRTANISSDFVYQPVKKVQRKPANMAHGSNVTNFTPPHHTSTPGGVQQQQVLTPAPPGQPPAGFDLTQAVMAMQQTMQVLTTQLANQRQEIADITQNQLNLGATSPYGDVMEEDLDEPEIIGVTNNNNAAAAANQWFSMRNNPVNTIPAIYKNVPEVVNPAQNAQPPQNGGQQQRGKWTQSRNRGRDGGRGRGRGRNQNNSPRNQSQNNSQRSNGSSGVSSNSSNMSRSKRGNHTPGMTKAMKAQVDFMINNAICKQKGWDETAAKEILIFGLPSTDNDLYADEENRAVAKLKLVLEDFGPDFIADIERFHSPDDNGFFPMKVKLNRLSVAIEIVEVAEEKAFPWFSRSRPKNVREYNMKIKNHVDDLNSKLPNNWPYTWGAIAVGAVFMVKRVPNPNYVAPAHTPGAATTNQSGTINKRPLKAAKPKPRPAVQQPGTEVTPSGSQSGHQS